MKKKFGGGDKSVHEKCMVVKKIYKKNWYFSTFPPPFFLGTGIKHQRLMELWRPEPWKTFSGGKPRGVAEKTSEEGGDYETEPLNNAPSVFVSVSGEGVWRSFLRLPIKSTGIELTKNPDINQIEKRGQLRAGKTMDSKTEQRSAPDGRRCGRGRPRGGEVQKHVRRIKSHGRGRCREGGGICTAVRGPLKTKPTHRCIVMHWNPAI